MDGSDIIGIVSIGIVCVGDRIIFIEIAKPSYVIFSPMHCKL